MSLESLSCAIQMEDYRVQDDAARSERSKVQGVASGGSSLLSMSLISLALEAETETQNLLPPSASVYLIDNATASFRYIRF
jgi:hypothetical protein